MKSHGLRSVAAGTGLSVAATLLLLQLAAFIPGFAMPVQLLVLGVVVALAVSAPVCIVLMRQQLRIAALHGELALAFKRLERSSRVDGMTGLTNRDVFIEMTRDAMADRDGWLIVADVDHFKQINDDFGHGVGDRVLVAIGNTIQDNLRAGDLCGRLGGEEFGLFLHARSGREAHVAAERLRRAVEQLAVSTFAGGEVAPTLSLGVTATRGLSLPEAMRRADEALYDAKRQGRNRTVSACAPSADNRLRLVTAGKA
ncbi:GGDEF domain-containing protein [Novosphingobium sp.]|jgi:diguanylate cyclase (GGDEF)-like protein|uniref:GGDEF domain-containing protein n=1 Tax=Novosphingobium sp. TaxID=1874826 RepID=UPI002FE33873